MQKRKIIQITLISAGFLLIIFTYFLYPVIKRSNNLEANKIEKKIEVEEEIQELEEKEQTLTDKIEEVKNYFTSSNLIKKQEEIQKLEVLQQDLIDQIQEEKESFNLGEPLKKLEEREQTLIEKIQKEKERIAKDESPKKKIIKDLENDLKKTTSSLRKKQDVIENLENELQKTSSLLAEKRSKLRKEDSNVGLDLETLEEDLEKTSNLLTNKREDLEGKEMKIKSEEGKSNTFKNVEYGGLYDLDKPFTVSSKIAYIDNESPDIVYMTNMHVALSMDDRVIIITSDKGNYNKMTYDCFFELNVKATDGETVILAENLDLLATEDSIIAYNNVYLTDVQGSLLADKVLYDVETKKYDITMHSDMKKVKVKLYQ